MTMHEPDVVATRPIAKIAVGSVVAFFAALGFALALLPREAMETPQPAPAVIGSLEQTPILDGDRGRHIFAKQKATLDRWQWVDRDAGVVEVPLDVAIDRMLADGGAP